MRMIFSIFVVVLFAVPIFAEEKMDKNSMQCLVFKAMASATMESRQAGLPIETALERVKGQAWFSEAMTNIILDAYSQPRYSTESEQKESIEEFGNKYFIDCMKVSK